MERIFPVRNFRKFEYTSCCFSSFAEISENDLTGNFRKFKSEFLVKMETTILYQGNLRSPSVYYTLDL